MTVLYAYKLENNPLLNELQLSEHYHINHLDSLDQIPKQLERPSVIFFSGQEPTLQTIVKRSQQQQQALTPIILTQGAAANLNNEELYRYCDYLQVPAPTHMVQNRLERALSYSQMQLQASTLAQYESTSGLYSYSYFLSRLKEEMAGSRRHGTPLTCIILKFSFYEAYLDTYGLDFIGDLYKRLGKTIQDSVRQEDIVARLGNDEIGLLLPQTTEAGSRILTQRMLEKATTVQAPNSGGYQEELIVHAGMASFPHTDFQDADPNTLLRYARHALHHARTMDEAPYFASFTELKSNGLSSL
jgi:diguanylate cyclase (GGDEF)-like protein